jgi:hypothetical protein
MRAKAWYDHKARLRAFEPGEEVLVLLLFPGKGLQVKYCGPYIVPEKLSSVDYEI